MKLNQKQKILFMDNLASLLNSWIPVMQAFSILKFQAKNKRILQVVDFMIKWIGTWENIHQIASRIPWVFGMFDVAIIETWEATGKIWRSFEMIMQKEEKEYDLSRKVKQALIYPLAIIIVTITMLTVIMVYVIPKIESIYKDANASLPAITTFVINCSHFFLNYWIFVLVWFGTLIFILFQIYKKVPNAKYQVDKAILEIPVFGNIIIKKKIIVNFTYFLSILLSSWIIINNALLIVRNAMDNSFYEKIVNLMLEEIKTWKPLSAAMWVNIMEDDNWGENLQLTKLKNKAFPIEISTAVRIGEQTWWLSRMLEKSSVRYTKEIDNVIKNLSTLLEPMIIVFIGIIVGFIVLAILMPFLNMVKVIW